MVLKLMDSSNVVWLVIPAQAGIQLSHGPGVAASPAQKVRSSGTSNTSRLDSGLRRNDVLSGRGREPVMASRISGMVL
ncbi:hypothetical protein, partial [Dyella sp. EPa41]|uniref:hypothetical protein n=1 Tax=Dyella sp. EPa41 TaxID=1561194 RepID=UPI001F213F82